MFVRFQCKEIFTESIYCLWLFFQILNAVSAVLATRMCGFVGDIYIYILRFAFCVTPPNTTPNRCLVLLYACFPYVYNAFLLQAYTFVAHYVHLCFLRIFNQLIFSCLQEMGTTTLTISYKNVRYVLGASQVPASVDCESCCPLPISH